MIIESVGHMTYTSRRKADADAPVWVATAEVPVRVLRVEQTTGRQELIRRLMSGDSGGVYNLFAFQATADGKTYAYSYRQTLSTLCVAEGLH